MQGPRHSPQDRGLCALLMAVAAPSVKGAQEVGVTAHKTATVIV
jgi:hypothetical protein